MSENLEDLENKIKILERKIRLSSQALEQAAVIRKKYDEDRETLNNSLEEKVEERTNELDRQRRYLQAIIDGVESPIMVIKNDYNIEIMNTALHKKIDYTIVKDKNHPKCYEVSHKRTSPCDGYEHPCPLHMVLANCEYKTVVHKHFDSAGNRQYVELAASPLYDNNNKCIGIIESARDITAYLESQDELREQKGAFEYLANHDFLTGLPNRILFEDRLNQAIEKGARTKESFAVFFIDLDRFKQINDSLGHKIGDEVLKEVSFRISSVIRKEDTLCRLGGDEFTILLNNIKKPQDASLLSKKILKVLSNPIIIECHTLYVSTSIGISLFPEDGDCSQNLLKYADAAMYKAKEVGRNNFQFYSASMTELALKHIMLETNLRQALQNNEFVVYYQPQINVVLNKLIGLEALVRWQHPTLGLVSPDAFLPLAEETGLIVEIDRWVMKTAINQLAQWYDQGFSPGMLALNLSMKQLQREDFIVVLKNIIKEAKCKMKWIELEITEGQIMTNPEKSIKLLEQINAIGIELAIDDFGIGYSSLSYLKRLPINKLKIDKSFVDNLPYDVEDVGIIRAIIAIAKSLNLKLLAEGVETKEQELFLINEKCENIQGYLHSRPLPADAIRDLFL